MNMKGYENMSYQYRWFARQLFCFLVMPAVFIMMPSPIFAQTSVPISPFPIWRSAAADPTDAAVWGDIDGDGDLDLVTINRTDVFHDAYYILIYRYEQNEWIEVQRLSSPGLYTPSDMALGDVDGDGDLDLAIAISLSAVIPFENILLHLNDSGRFQEHAAWGNPSNGATVNKIHWGDVDGDGDLDLAAATREGAKLLLNDHGQLSPSARHTENENETYSLAWADVDGDQDLDLAVGGASHVALYHNTEGRLESTATWTSNEPGLVHDLAWGDIDGDQYPDLVVGTDGVNLLYLNKGGLLQTEASWRSEDVDNTQSMAFGDVDGDGDLDLAVGNKDATNKVYLAVNGQLQNTASWESEAVENTRTITLVDIDNDGDLDLATASDNREKIYLNQGLALQRTPAWSSQESDNTSSVAWGDMDGDGDLDLAVGNIGATNKVYLNQNGRLQEFAAWTSQEADNTNSVAWGDVDGDGDLDLAVGNDGSTDKLYLNTGHRLQSAAAWSSESVRETWSIAWGDVDNDGDLDLAAVGSLERPRVYYNEKGNLQQSPEEMRFACLSICSLAWGDVDNDGDLDLATGTAFSTAFPGSTNSLYINDSGLLQQFSSWSSGERESSSTVAWADVDGDSDLDLVTINPNGPNKIYLNDKGSLQPVADWTSQAAAESQSAAWGDVDGDGDLDLAVGNSAQNQIYLNNGNGLQSQTTWTSQDAADTHAIAWGDMDGDGNLDLAVGNNGENQVFLFNRPAHSQQPTNEIINIAFNMSDVEPSQPANKSTPLVTPANGYAISQIRSGVIPISYNLTYPSSHPEPSVNVYFSLNGGGHWQKAIAAAPEMPNRSDGHQLYLPIIRAATGQATKRVQRVFYWDVNQSTILGQSDNVVVRLVASNIRSMDGVSGSHRYVNGAAKTFQRAQVSATTFPFRVRGTQTRVVDENGVGKAEAVVYRLLAGQTNGALAYAQTSGEPFRTNSQGYLQGRGELTINRDSQQADHLVALWPISPTLELTFTNNVRFFQTSASVTDNGLQLTPATQSGVLTLTVSPDNLLALFDLDISLEWDARNDESFLLNLRNALQRASEVLYDVTNGQAALGNVHIYQNKEHWGVADVVVYANNSLRPRATMGGFVDEPLNDIDRNGIVLTEAYGRGQIRMGPNWDPFGQSDAELTQDWWRALAHELAHYLLFLPDNYLGLDDNGALRITNCRGSFMTSAYDSEDYSEFLTETEWIGDCRETMAERITGRPDWETIHRFYPMFAMPSTPLAGPNLLPLAVTEITIMDPDPTTSGQPIAARNLDLRDEEGNLLTLTQAQAYLFKTNGTITITEAISDDYLVALGSTGAGRDRILMRGAEAGDRLCVISGDQRMVGCKQAVGPTETALTMRTVDNWQPDIDVRHVSSTTMMITVTGQLPLEPLKLQVLPAQSALTSTFVVTSPWQIKTPDGPGQPLTFTVRLDAPSFEGFVRLCGPCSEDNESAREAIIQFFLSPAWGPGNRGGSTFDTDRRDWFANRRALEAPIASGDGKVTILNVEDILADTGTSSLQALSSLPNLPSFLAPVGPSYRFVATAAVTRTIAFQYLQRDVPPGYEHTLNIYFLPTGSSEWQRLETGPLATGADVEDNLATARMPNMANGEGIYALMATVELPVLQRGWNLLAYPLPGEAAIGEALQSIDGSYSVVYHYDTDTAGGSPWRVYDPKIAEHYPDAIPFIQQINTLEQLTFGSSYWIHATEPITPYLPVPVVGDDTVVRAAEIAMDFGLPPATFFGILKPTGTITPTVGMAVTATIDGQLCGESTVKSWQGTLSYSLSVVSSFEKAGCGDLGRNVVIAVGGQMYAAPQTWDNRRIWLVPPAGIAPSHPTSAGVHMVAGERQIFVPLVMHNVTIQH